MLGEIGSNCGLLGVNLGRILVVWNQTLPILAPTGAHLGRYLHPFGLHGGYVGANNSHVGTNFGHLGANLGSLESSWGHFGAYMKLSSLTYAPYLIILDNFR